jgi:hypothetical protein
VASQIAEVSGLDVDVQPISYVPTVEPYVAVFLGWSGHSRAGRRETLRFLSRNAALLPDRRVWVVHHQPGVDDANRPQQGQGPVRLSRLLLRHGVVPGSYDGPTADLDEATDSVEDNPILVPAELSRAAGRASAAGQEAGDTYSPVRSMEPVQS